MKYFALLTKLGENLLAQATALGTKLELTHMAVGDGGGSLPTPDTNQTKLIAEKRRAAINTLFIDDKNKNQIIAEQIIPEQDGGWWIREIGLFDKAGNLIAVANCPETYKPQLAEGSGRTQSIRMVLIVSHTESVTLKIDPSVVLATREYVNTEITVLDKKIDALSAQIKLDLNKKFDKANISGQKGNDNDKVPSLNLFTTEIGKLAAIGYSYSKIESDAKFQQKDAPSLRLVGVNSTKKINLFPPQADSEEAYFQYNDGTSWSGRVKIPITDDVSTLYSSGNTTKDDNGFVRTGKKTALITENVVQSTGKSEFDVMSQKAVTDALESKFNKSGGFLDGGISVKNDVIAQYLRLLDSTSTRRINLVPPNADSTEAYFQYNEGTSWFGRLIIPMTTGITTLYSSGNTTTDSSGFVRTGSKTALITDNVAQAVGTSTSNVMSQKAVTDALLGVNQNWVDVKSQRNANTDYTNSTGKPIFVSIGKEGGGNAGALYINGVRVGSMTGGDPAMTISAIVPAGGVYKYTSTNIAIWVELR